MPLTYFAAETAHTATEGGLFGALGIDWRLLILQIIAFGLMAFLLGKFVYPWLMKSVDAREADIKAAARAADDAKKAADKAEAERKKVLKEARAEAAAIVSTAKTEASDMVTAGEAKAKAHADRIIASGREQLEKAVAQARQALLGETAELVSDLTKKAMQGNNA